MPCAAPARRPGTALRPEDVAEAGVRAGEVAGPCEDEDMIRPATPADVPVIHAMVRELAEYEKAVEEAVATEEQLRQALFGERPAVYAHMAVDDATGEPAGFAMWFLGYCN